MSRPFLLLALMRFAKLGLVLASLMLYGRIFGIGVQMDAWVVASGVVAAAGMFVWGPVNEIVRSRFLQHAARDGFQTATEHATRLLRLTALGSVILAGLMWLAGPLVLPWLYAGETIESELLVSRMFALMLPSLVLGQTLALGSAYLNCCEVIYTPEWIGIGAALVSLLSVYILSPYVGIFALVAAHYTGLVLSVVCVLALLLRRRFFNASWRPFAGPMVRDYLAFSAPLYFSYSAGQANGLFERALASSIGVGMVSSVNYASQFKSTLQAVLSSVLFSLAVPKLSKAAMSGGWKEFADAWQGVQRVVAMFLLVVLPPFWGCADLIVEVLFGAARIRADKLGLVAELIRWYLAALIPVGLYLVHGSALLAQQKGRSYAVWGVVAQAMSAGCCLLFVHILGPQVFPFSLMLSHGVAAIGMARAAGPSRALWLELLRWSVALVVASVALHGIAAWISSRTEIAAFALALVGGVYGVALLGAFAIYRFQRRLLA